MINQQKVYNMIGLCKKANKLVTGVSLCENDIRKKRVLLAILAEDAGANTKKDIKNICAYYEVELVEFGTGDMLGKITNSSRKTVVGVKDNGFKKEILKRINNCLGENR